MPSGIYKRIVNGPLKIMTKEGEQRIFIINYVQVVIESMTIKIYDETIQ
jgi:hypothetical protein